LAQIPHSIRSSPSDNSIFHAGNAIRQYYTNQGPLTQQLEEKLQKFLRVKHSVCVTNATIGLMMTAEAMGLSGKVIMPACTFIASAQSLSWTGIEPVFCDINVNSGQIEIEQISALIDIDVSAIMGISQCQRCSTVFRLRSCFWLHCRWCSDRQFRACGGVFISFLQHFERN
jgi:dTDP-4-amino-4,6-dideoxygalactose transaminase